MLNPESMDHETDGASTDGSDNCELRKEILRYTLEACKSWSKANLNISRERLDIEKRFDRRDITDGASVVLV